MGIFIKNPQTEKVVREVAALRGTSITGVIDSLAREALEHERNRPRPRKHSLDEMRAATREFRRKTGLDRQDRKPSAPKSVWDALWPTGMREIDGS